MPTPAEIKVARFIAHKNRSNPDVISWEEDVHCPALAQEVASSLRSSGLGVHIEGTWVKAVWGAL